MPPFLPDMPGVRDDLLDYALQVEVADAALGQQLEERGELERTLIIVTSDNGIMLPRAKGSLYDLGKRVPLAIAWDGVIPAGRVLDDLLDLIDVAPSVLHR